MTAVYYTYCVRLDIIVFIPYSEAAFREVLVAAEQELVELRIKLKDYQTNQSGREKAQREASRLKGIINSQEKQVSTICNSIVQYCVWGGCLHYVVDIRSSAVRI